MPTVTVAHAVSPPGSSIAYSNVSSPSNDSAGVYSRAGSDGPATSSTVPPLGVPASNAVMVSASPLRSTSLSSTATRIGVPPSE